MNFGKRLFCLDCQAAGEETLDIDRELPSGMTITFRTDATRSNWSIRFSAAPELGIDIDSVDVVGAAELVALALSWHDDGLAGNRIGADTALHLLRRYILDGPIVETIAACGKS